MSEGRALPNLPGSVRSLISQSSGPRPKALQLEIVDQTVEEMAEPMDGLVRVDLVVLPARASEQRGRS